MTTEPETTINIIGISNNPLGVNSKSLTHNTCEQKMKKSLFGYQYQPFSLVRHLANKGHRGLSLADETARMAL